MAKKSKLALDPVAANATCTLEVIDAHTAQRYLENLMEDQRHLREGHVMRLATEMEQGHFRLSPDCLLFVKGKLANGQHRLQGLILCGKPQPFLVMRSNDEELYKVLDCGVLRTVGDALHNMTNAKDVAAAAKLILLYDIQALTLMGSKYEKRERITRSHILDYIEGHAEALTKEVAECANLNRQKHILSVTLSSALLHLINRKGDGNGLTFIRNVYLGESADAAFDLREKLIRNAQSKAKLRREYLFGLLIKAYKSFVNGTRPGVLRILDGEEFPKL